MRGLLPDPDVLFEVILLDLLPSNARDAALQHSSLDDMATAADLIVAENAVAATSPSIAAVREQEPDDSFAVVRRQHQLRHQPRRLRIFARHMPSMDGQLINARALPPAG